jgi:Ras GTPase-activating-like protein IQGAP2/3
MSEALETIEDLPQEEVGEALPEGEDNEVDENAHLFQWKNPIAASNDPEETDEDRLLYYKERECCVLLLEARRILSCMVDLREKEDEEAWKQKRLLEEKNKKETGKMSCQEIQELLQNQPDDDMSDWINRIQELKRLMVIQIRNNYLLDRDLSNLDKKIALLIKNKGNVQDIRLKSSRKKKVTESKTVFAADPRKLEHYQNFFYLLQTEPRYLAKCVYLVNAEQMESFLETTILTLYGDAYTPREEFLILKLFQLAIQHEISMTKGLSDFVGGDSVVPKMLITYNRRKQGTEYLKKTLQPLLSSLMEKTELNLELHPLIIYQGIINDQEMETGQKSTLERGISQEQALQNPDVKRILTARTQELERICQSFLDGIIRTIDDLPYGIRWITKQLRDLYLKAMPNAAKEDIIKLQMYFVYYRFINLAIVTPDSFNIVDTDIPAVARKNLVFIAKVLQNVFNFREFTANDNLAGLNEFINRSKPALLRYVDDVPRVEDPEDHLQVTRYNELTHQTKPVISISLHEIYNTHSLVAKHLDALAPDKEDPLRQIMVDLGAPPENVSEEDDREIQLTLTNRFKVEVEEENEIQKLIAETKELVIPILRLVPIQNTIQRLTLMDILEYGIKHATENNNRDLSNKINQVLENLGKLEKEDVVSKEDNYESFIHDVALEVANRSAIREQQRKEIIRLTNTLENLTKYEGFVRDKIKEYQEYVDQCIKQTYNPSAKKSFKFSYKDLSKRGVIIDSDVPTLSRGKTVFNISSTIPGSYEVKAKIAGIRAESMELRIDDLLEKQFNGIDRLELDQITLDVNMTIRLLNEKFLGKKK